MASETTGQPPTPEELRDDIAQTREQLGDTVEALAAKADVKAQAKAKVDEIKHSAQERKEHIKDAALGKAQGIKSKAGDATPESAAQARDRAVTVAKDNPLPLAAIGAFAGGFLLGRLTRR